MVKLLLSNRNVLPAPALVKLMKWCRNSRYIVIGMKNEDSDDKNRVRPIGDVVGIGNGRIRGG